MDDRQLNPTRILTATALGGLAALAAYSLLIEPSRVQISHYDLPLPGLPDAWIGKRMIHLTDLHYGDPRSERLFRWLVQTVNSLEPDLIVITGDYVVDAYREAVHAVRHLRNLQARHGIVGVLGDHDFNKRTRQEIPGVPQLVADSGVQLLRNSGVELTGGLRLTGVEPTTHKVARANLDLALRNTPGGRPHLLLSHSPDIIAEAAERDVPMILSGHTHGGQVVVPFYGPPITHSRFGKRFAAGWGALGNTRVFTGRGLASHYSLRFGCPPEIVVFTLQGDTAQLPHG